MSDALTSWSLICHLHLALKFKNTCTINARCKSTQIPLWMVLDQPDHIWRWPSLCCDIGSQPGVNQWRLVIFYLGGATGSEGFCLYTSNTVVKVGARSLTPGTVTFTQQLIPSHSSAWLLNPSLLTPSRGFVQKINLNLDTLWLLTQMNIKANLNVKCTFICKQKIHHVLTWLSHSAFLLTT